MTTLTDAELAALWPAVTDDLSLSEELTALEREFQRREARRALITFMLGGVAGVAVATILACLWLFF